MLRILISTSSQGSLVLTLSLGILIVWSSSAFSWGLDSSHLRTLLHSRYLQDSSQNRSTLHILDLHLLKLPPGNHPSLHCLHGSVKHSGSHNFNAPFSVKTLLILSFTTTAHSTHFLHLFLPHFYILLCSAVVSYEFIPLCTYLGGLTKVGLSCSLVSLYPSPLNNVWNMVSTQEK